LAKAGGDDVNKRPLDALESDVAARLTASRQTLATAESCTGGLLAHRLTEAPGASVFFIGGVITYSNESKQFLLGVESQALETQGAVSALVAEQMARGVRERLGTDFGIGITGIAGPAGGTAEKPVGLVFISVAGPEATRVTRNQFSGTRSEIKQQSARRALEMLQEQLA
jgi:nicotinamide-nucleotide amidase